MAKRARNLPQISDAEWTVMQVFWSGGDLSTGQVIKALEKQTDWNPRTIQTLIRRLHKKGALEVTSRIGREYVYRPTVAESESEHAASQTFLGRVFDGKLTPFLASFVENGSVSKKEIDELRRLLDKAEAAQQTKGGSGS